MRIKSISAPESRRLEVRCGIKKDKKDPQERKVYVHMLNGTLCATTRAMSCIAENYQTPKVRLFFYPHQHIFLCCHLQGLVIPEVLRPYMQGREFLPWVKELPKGLQRKQA